jgi:hypothetical protein
MGECLDKRFLVALTDFLRASAGVGVGVGVGLGVGMAVGVGVGMGFGMVQTKNKRVWVLVEQRDGRCTVYLRLVCGAVIARITRDVHRLAKKGHEPGHENKSAYSFRQRPNRHALLQSASG